MRKSILLVSLLALTSWSFAQTTTKTTKQAAATKTTTQAASTSHQTTQSSAPNDSQSSASANATSDKSEKTPPATVPQTDLLRIGSGAVGGNYFVLAALVGGAVSHPSGSLPCDMGGTCGVLNMQAQNVTTVGSLANLTRLDKGDIETGFVQSDIAYWAYTGTGLFNNKQKHTDIRAIASLYPEAIHIIVRKDAKITTVRELMDKRVSVGARKSGTLLGARLILSAYQMSEDDMETEYLNSQQSIEKLAAGELDAVFFTVGTPAPALTGLFESSSDFSLLSIEGAQQQEIFKQGHYFSPYTIAADVYKGIPETKTISVYALWLTNESTDNELVYALTKSLWSKAARQLLDSSFIGQQIHLDNSLKGIGIPLHEGAKKYYNKIGKRF